MPPFPSGNNIEQLLLEQGQRRAQLTQQLGQIAADTQARNSQLWGNSLAQLGQLPMQMYGLKAAQQEMQIRQAQEKRLEQELADQQAQRNYGMVRQAAIGSAIQAVTDVGPDGLPRINRDKLQGLFAQNAGAFPLEDQDKVFKSLDAIEASGKKFQDAKMAHLADIAAEFYGDGRNVTADTVRTGLATGKLLGSVTDEDIAKINQALDQPGADPKRLLQAVMAGDPGQRFKDRLEPKPVSVAAGAALVNPATGETVFQAPERPVSVAAGASLVTPSTGAAVFTAPPNPETVAARTETARHDQVMEALARQRLAQGGGGGATGAAASLKEQQAQEIGDAIISGDQPPEMTRLFGLAGPVKAYLATKKYNLTKATEDWTATQKYLGTLNGQQQTRLRQAVNFVSESLPVVRQLVNQWDSAGLPVLSKANLDMAAKGGYGKTQQSLAVRLKAQIADVQSELGTVYKGGNSSTDESLRLAAENLQGEWSKKAALDALDQIEKNMAIRTNSMRNTGVAGVTNNQYAPQTAPAAKRFNPATGKIE